MIIKTTPRRRLRETDRLMQLSAAGQPCPSGRSARCSTPPPTTGNHANDTVVPFAMIETREPLSLHPGKTFSPGQRWLDAILYVGPADLSLALGLHPRPSTQDGGPCGRGDDHIVARRMKHGVVRRHPQRHARHPRMIREGFPARHQSADAPVSWRPARRPRSPPCAMGVLAQAARPASSGHLLKRKGTPNPQYLGRGVDHLEGM